MPESIEVARTLYERFHQGDIAGALACFGDDCEVEFIGPRSIPFAGVYRGGAGMGEALQKITSTCDILELAPDEFHADGEFVTVLGHEHCRNNATGREWKSPLVETLLVRDGKIRKFRCMYDTAAVVDAFRGAPASATYASAQPS